ncbi:MAG TPA: DUF4412 domain-containing protein [Halalkalibaculum sp.]|nr:DUF4412 domain-containing protein [Halalkalibaculum sp.]
MKNQSSLFFTLLLLFLSTEYAHAQFEGKVVYNNYEMKSGEKVSEDRFTMFVTTDRILLQGDNSYDLMGNIKTEGVLIRLDFEDFVFLTGKDKALKISKVDITSMMNLFGGDSKKDMDTDISYEKTGETETINGYASEKFIFSDKADGKDYVAVWMTRDIKFNWGMLAEPWGDDVEGMISGDFPISLIFEEGYFPLRIESYQSGELKTITEAEEINESSIAKAMVQIPSGVSVLSLQNYLFQQLSEQ